MSMKRICGGGGGQKGNGRRAAPVPADDLR